jgi:thioredoxin 1
VKGGGALSVSYAVTITDASFKSEVYASDEPVLVDFWAAWCEPCKALEPILDDLSAELRGQVKFARLDVDSNPTTTASFGIHSIPALVLFKNGKPAARLVGPITKQLLMERLASHLI